MVSKILLSLVLTLIIELTISIVLGIRGKDILRIIFINIMTNVPLNIIVNLLYMRFDPNIIFYCVVPILEILVFIIEGRYFKKLDNSIINPYKLSFLLNIFSYGYSFVYLIISYLIK